MARKMKMLLIAVAISGIGIAAEVFSLPPKATAVVTNAAAAMPVCGGGDPSLAWKIRSVPIWTFHGDKDNAVPVVRSRQMVSALWQCDGNVRYREYPGIGHNCWIPTYDDDQVLDWFFSQTKTSGHLK